MNVATKQIDIKESILRRTGELLDILLISRTTKKNIIWATDSYENYGKEFSTKSRIKPELVTGKYHLLIQPRAAKSIAEQRKRTKEKAEVFTPLKIVDQINVLLEGSTPDKDTWQSYVRELKIEITVAKHRLS
jgi:type II restriction enzyme